VKKIRFVGLDVHAEKFAIAIAEHDGEVRFLGVVPNREDSVRRMMRKLGDPQSLRVCYEAGPTGFVLYWQLTAMGIECNVKKPSQPSQVQSASPQHTKRVFLDDKAEETAEAGISTQCERCSIRSTAVN
jgi:hypothetical protein